MSNRHCELFWLVVATVIYNLRYRIMTFDRSLGEFRGKLELQTFLYRYGRSCPFVNLLGLIMLLIALPARGQGGGTHTTLDQVNQAVRETRRLCEEQIEKGAVPGLAIAVVYQDQVVYAAGFGVRDVNTREPVNAEHCVPVGIVIQSNWLNCRSGTCRRR